MDIRGIERVRPAPQDHVDGDEEDRVLDGGGQQRAWFIQCKREKTLGPAKARAVAASALAGAPDPPYRFILAAPCDLSKRSRDTLSVELRAAGVRQVLAWGRGGLYQ